MVYAQYFQGSFFLGNNDTLVFKIKPTGGNISTRLAYFECSFRFLTAQAPGLTASTPVSNTNLFGTALNVTNFPPAFVNAGYTYFKYVHNTGPLNLINYTSGSEYEVFKIKLSQKIGRAHV